VLARGLESAQDTRRACRGSSIAPGSARLRARAVPRLPGRVSGGGSAARTAPARLSSSRSMARPWPVHPLRGRSCGRASAGAATELLPRVVARPGSVVDGGCGCVDTAPTRPREASQWSLRRAPGRPRPNCSLFPLEAGGARRVLNDYFFPSALQLKRGPLGSDTNSSSHIARSGRWFLAYAP